MRVIFDADRESCEGKGRGISSGGENMAKQPAAKKVDRATGDQNERNRVSASM